MSLAPLSIRLKAELDWDNWTLQAELHGMKYKLD